MEYCTLLDQAQAPPWMLRAADRGPDFELSEIRSVINRPYLSNTERHLLYERMRALLALNVHGLDESDGVSIIPFRTRSL